MAEDALVLQTQETLGKLISKPKMTEKYLKKPPFRFLHDIVFEVIRTTEFGQGLFTTDEADATKLADKQAKVDFLNKSISLVSFALNEKIDVSANKIVAGLEAEKTNLWLQKLHQAATTCPADKAAESVQRVMQGDTVAAPKKEKKKKEEDAAPPPPPPEGAEPAAAGAADADEETRKKEERRAKRKEEEKRKKMEAEAAAAAEAAGAAAAGEQAAAASAAAQAAEEEARRAEEEKKKKEEDRRRRDERKRQQAEEEERRRQEDAEAAAAAQEMDLPPPPPMDGGAEEQHMMAGAMDGGGMDLPPAPPMEQPPEDGELPAGMARQGQTVPGTLERPRTAGRRPPKVQSKVAATQENTDAPAAVITEGDKNDDGDECFEEPTAAGGTAAVTAGAGEQHGKLVQDLLAQRKQEEEKERLRKEEEATREVAEEGGAGGIRMGKLKKKKQGASNVGEIDVAKLGDMIQQLCQAANPLGKSIDLVHQDIANMGKELDKWKAQYAEASEQYQNELRSTEEQLQPLYQKVAELDDRLYEQVVKIRNSRSRIAENDQQIGNLLQAVVAAK